MFKEPYCTIAEADLVNDTSTWLSLDDDAKMDALKWGRVYLDSKYRCSTNLTTDEELEAFEAKKIANAILGNEYVLGNLFTVIPTDNAVLTAKSVKAGSVTVSKKYAESSGAPPVDQFPRITSLLYGYCSLINSSFRNVNVIRM